MPIIACPSCRARLQLAEANLGRLVRCPKCQNDFKAASPNGNVAEVRPALGELREQVRPGEPPAGWSRPEAGDAGNPDWFSEGLGEQSLHHGERRGLLRDLPGLGLSRVAVVVLAVNLLVTLIGLGLAFVLLGQISGMRPGLPAPRQLEDIDSLRMSVGLLSFAVQIATIVVFCMWIYRAHDNLALLGVEGCKYTPGWAVGFFFVPILNLVRPLQVVQEIWKASDPRIPPGSPEWMYNGNSALAGFWWAFWLTANITANIGLRMTMSEASSLEELRLGVGIEIASDLAYLVAGLLVIILIQLIMKRQASMLNADVSDDARDSKTG